MKIANKSKKFLSLLIALVLLLGLMPIASITAHAAETYNLITVVTGPDESNLHGTVSPGKENIPAGTVETVTFTPEEGYEIERVRVNDVDQNVTGNTLDVKMDSEKHLTVSFKKIVQPKEYDVIFSPNGGTGEMAKETAVENDYYTLPQCGFSPPSGYVFDAWQVKDMINRIKAGDKFFIAPGFQAESINAIALWKDENTRTIDRVDAVGLTAPKAGNTPSTEGITFEQTDVILVNSSWGRYNEANKTFTEMENSETFAAGEKYAISIEVKTAELAEFADTIQATVNGISAIEIRELSTDNRLSLIICVFPPAEDATEKVTVSFDANGGSGRMLPVEVEKDAEYTLPENIFIAPENQEFKAWDVKGIEKAAGESITVRDDIVVKAIWRQGLAPPGYYNVVFNEMSSANVIFEGEALAKHKVAYTCKITPNPGFALLKSKIVVYVEGISTEDSYWTYDPDSFELTIKAEYVVGYIQLQAEAIPIGTSYRLDTSVNGGNGEVSKGKSGIAAGTVETVKFTPAAGYEIDKVTLNGAVTAVSGNTLEITMNEDMTVVVSYKAIKAPILVLGKDLKWRHESVEGAIFKSDAAFEEFVRVEIDGKAIAAKYYTVASGSTVVTIKSEYLKTLSAGKHKIGIVSKTGTAVGEFEILAAKANAVPKTGDTQNLAPALLIMLLSSSALAGTLITRRKRAYGK